MKHLTREQRYTISVLKRQGQKNKDMINAIGNIQVPLVEN